MRIVTAYTMLHASMQACTEANERNYELSY